MSICPISDLPQEYCAHCRSAPAAPAPATDGPLAGLDFGGRSAEVGPVVVAEHPGWCACACGTEIEPGFDRIAMVEGQGWTLEDCL